MKKTLTLALAGTIFMALSAGAQAEQKWSIATSSTGSGPYINGSAIAKKVSDNTDKLAVSAQTSGGYNENLSLVVSGQADIGMTLLADLRDAYKGEGKFEKIPNAKETFSSLRRLFPVTLAVMHCAVRADSGIGTFEDLKGKKFNINVPATATQQINRAMIDALGMKATDFQIFEIATSKSYDALGDGIVDATCNGQPAPSGSVMQLAAVKPVDLLPLPQDAFDKLNKTYNGTMIRTTVPANTYAGQEEAVETFAYPEVLFVHADADEELVYQFTAAYWDGKPLDMPAFNGLTLENAAVDVDPPLHPGVARYLREKGLLK